MELTEEWKEHFIGTAQKLKGSNRRKYMAEVAQKVGSERKAARELGWVRGTIRKGQQELKSGIDSIDAFHKRGRKRSEEQLPNLRVDVQAIVEGETQTDPSFKSSRLYTRLSANEVRQQLIKKKGYTDEQLPSVRTISNRLNAWGYHLKRVSKSKPKKKIAETDAIFEQLKQVHEASAQDPTTLRLSMDAKATVKIGDFSRNGQNRVVVKAADHDFRAEATVTPVGILLPELDALFLYQVTSKVTSDCLVDILEIWWATVQTRFPEVKTLLINLDNGPESHSRRTQFLKRIIDFAFATGLTIQLAYYPPYHSKYNPIERCWAILEQHWNGDLLDSLDTVVAFSKTMTWQGKHPLVTVLTKAYSTGVKLTKKAMELLESQVSRLDGLKPWFLQICPTSFAPV